MDIKRYRGRENLKGEKVMSFAYVGCRTTKERNARGKGIKVFEITDKTGEWTEKQCLKTEENPSYLAFDNEENYLYSVHGDLTSVSSYKVKEDGTLSFLNQIEIGGKNPVYLTVDKTNHWLIVATLQGGTVYSIELKDNGELGEIKDRFVFEGKNEGQISFVHQCIWDNTKSYIFAPAQGRDQGYGQIRVLKFDSETGLFTETCKVIAQEKEEPRHVAVHPNNRFVYMINEKGNSVEYFSFDEQTGILEPRQKVSTLPDTYMGAGQASTVAIDETGKYLIGSNRTFDALVWYRIDEQTGYLKTIGFTSTIGKTPRFMGFNKTKDKLYVANEDSDTIIEMQFDKQRELVECTGRIIKTESPVCIVFR